jgi:hypothetical protein
MNWKITQNGITIKEGHPADVREKIEEMIEERIGLFLSLQEDEEEGYIYLHSEYVEDLTDKEIDQVNDLGITENYDETTISALKKLLGIKIKTN